MTTSRRSEPDTGAGAERRWADRDRPVFVISVAADLLGVHPQTLRSYERAGLVSPARTAGGRRRYSVSDVARLRRVLDLGAQGLPLAAVARIVELEDRIAALTGTHPEAVSHQTLRPLRSPPPTGRRSARPD